MLAPVDVDGHGASEGLRPAHRHRAPRDQGELGEVAEEGGVAVRDAPNSGLLARDERFE